MKAFLLCFVILAALRAQPQRFDQFTFTPPAGYSVSEQKRDRIGYAKIDSQKRFYCQIVVYSSQPTTGTPEGDFQKEWKEAVEVAFRPKAKPATRPFALPKAANSYFGLSATTDNNGNPAITSLWVVRFPARYVGVIFNVPSEEAVAACQGDATSVAASIQLEAGATTVTAASGSPVGHWERVVQTRMSVRSNRTTGGYDYDRFATMRQFMDVHQFRLDANGTYVYELAGFDHNKSERYRVVERGTFKVNGGTIQFQPREISEGRAPSGQEPSLSPRQTPAAHSRNYQLTQAGLQLQAGNGWDTYTAVR